MAGSPPHQARPLRRDDPERIKHEESPDSGAWMAEGSEFKLSDDFVSSQQPLFHRHSGGTASSNPARSTIRSLSLAKSSESRPKTTRVRAGETLATQRLLAPPPSPSLFAVAPSSGNPRLHGRIRGARGSEDREGNS